MSGVVKVRSLRYGYPRRQILEDVSFTLNRGECTAVLATNGTGKSTLLKCLNKIWRPQGGVIEIANKNIDDYKRRELAQNIVYVAQDTVCARATVFDTILLGRKPYIKWDVTRKDMKIVEDIMKLLNIEEYALRYTDELSGGERQKVLIGRALAQQPQVLMLDEPTSSLDIKNQLEVLNIIKGVVRKDNISAIVTMHDLNLALRFADRFIFLKNGYIYAEGGCEIITKENIEHIYEIPVMIENINNQSFVIPL